MRFRWLLTLAAVGLVSVSAPALPAAEPQAAEPAIIVRVKSVSALLEDVKYLAALSGQGEAADRFLGQVLGPDGKLPAGIDGKRPLGLYGNIGPNILDSSVVALIPFSDERAFVKLLEGYQLKLSKGKDDVYSVEVPNAPIPVPIYLRFAHQYACIAVLDKDALGKERLLPPAKLLATTGSEVASVRIQLNQIPNEVKQLVLGQLELNLANLQDQKVEGETEAQKKLREASVKETTEQIASLIRDGRGLALQLDVDRNAHTLAVELGLTAEPKSKLQTAIADLTKGQSHTAGLISKDSAVHGLIRSAVPESLRQSFVASMDEAFHKALAEEKDPARKRMAEKFYKMLEPTLKTGELDAAADLRGPGSKGLFTLVAGLRVKDGKSMDRELAELVKDLPEADRAKIQLNAESAGQTKIHRLDIHKDAQYSADAKQTFGENPLYLAFGPDLLVLSFGEGGLAALKQTLTVSPKTAPALHVEASMAKLSTMPGAKDAKAAAKAAQEAFGGKKGEDTIRLTLEGGEALRLRFDMKTAVIKFFGLMPKEEPPKDNK